MFLYSPQYFSLFGHKINNMFGFSDHIFTHITTFSFDDLGMEVFVMVI